jgi:hypothetical protein
LLRQRVLELSGFEVVRPETKRACLEALRSGRFDRLVICHSVSVDSAREITAEFKRRNPDSCVVAVLTSPWAYCPYPVDVHISGTDGPDTLVETVRNCEQQVQS